MPEEILTREIAERLMKIKGEGRGFAIKQDGEYILKVKGKKDLAKVEKELERVGCPIKYQEVKNMDFIPAGLRAISLLAIKKTLNFDDEEIRKICAFQAKTPLVVKLYMKYFYSLSKVMKKAQKMWSVYWTIGEFKFVEYTEHDKKAEYAIVRIEGIDLHPIWCRCNEGFLESIGQLVIGKKNITCRETKCTSKGDKFHEHLIKW